jgi:FixJ family two-component response regulator
MDTEEYLVRSRLFRRLKIGSHGQLVERYAARLVEDGLARQAKAAGKYRGGIPTARAKAEQVFALVNAGKTREAAAEELGISIRSVFRILRTRKEAEKAPVAPLVARIRTRPQIES